MDPRRGAWGLGADADPFNSSSPGLTPRTMNPSGLLTRSLCGGILNLGRLGFLDRGLKRPNLACGRAQKLVGHALAEVAQRLPVRQSIPDKADEFRTLNELVVIGRVRGLDVGEIENIDMLGGEPALIRLCFGIDSSKPG